VTGAVYGDPIINVGSSVSEIRIMILTRKALFFVATDNLKILRASSNELHI